jgi:hypothetical protein
VIDRVCGAERRIPDVDGLDSTARCIRAPHDDSAHDGPIGDPTDPAGWAYWRKSRIPMPNLSDDLRTPQSGPVDPDRCPMCEQLRAVLRTAVLLGSQTSAGNLVRIAHTHMIHGHPRDPRTRRTAPA